MHQIPILLVLRLYMFWAVFFCPSSGVLSRTSAKNSWWWAERLPETCRVVIPIRLEFGASVG